MFREFLDEPMRLAQVAAVSPSGLPMLGSLWFSFENERFWFHSAAGSPLLEVARNGESVAVIVDDFDPPDRIIQVRVRGEGAVEPDDPEQVARIYGRYLGEELGTWPVSFPERISDPAWNLWSVAPRSGRAVESSLFIDEQDLRWSDLAECPL